jgi:hypothetical protein
VIVLDDDDDVVVVVVGVIFEQQTSQATLLQRERVRWSSFFGGPNPNPSFRTYRKFPKILVNLPSTVDTASIESLIRTIEDGRPRWD